MMVLWEPNKLLPASHKEIFFQPNKLSLFFFKEVEKLSNKNDV